MGQFHDVTAYAATVMHQDERLLVVHAHVLVTPAFPSRLLNKPAGRNLYFVMGLLIVRNARIFLFQRLELCPVNNGILEEAACAANLFHIG